MRAGEKGLRDGVERHDGAAGGGWDFRQEARRQRGASKLSEPQWHDVCPSASNGCCWALT